MSIGVSVPGRSAGAGRRAGGSGARPPCPRAAPAAAPAPPRSAPAARPRRRSAAGVPAPTSTALAHRRKPLYSFLLYYKSFTIKV